MEKSQEPQKKLSTARNVTRMEMTLRAKKAPELPEFQAKIDASMKEGFLYFGLFSDFIILNSGRLADSVEAEKKYPNILIVSDPFLKSEHGVHLRKSGLAWRLENRGQNVVYLLTTDLKKQSEIEEDQRSENLKDFDLMTIGGVSFFLIYDPVEKGKVHFFLKENVDHDPDE